MDCEGNTKKRKRSATGTAANTSSASASGSGSGPGGEYEVFLSFRGKDTRYGFTDYLYTDLVGAGIRTFRDDDKLRAGEEIGPELLKAIQDSKISIPIFSENYASSKWCLRQLVHMVECHRTMGQKILPIFFDVVPSDVRHQTGCYEKAFRRHGKRFDEKTVQGWKEALREVGGLKGWELEKETNGHQGELVKMVVSNVLLELKKNYMVVSENLVGMDHHVEKMMELLNVDSSDVSIIGIHGMGGIGKTTIAKVIYNRLSERFKCRCFLADVREWSQQHKGLVELQTRLVSKILKGKCPDIADDDEGINTIKDTVCRKKVLIVLDDVDKKSQFDKLAGKCDWFGSGSRIIVTTRDKEVLNQLEAGGTYEPPMMEPDHSLQLFSRHAFRRDFPPEDYDFLSREIVSIAAGLPLALELIGSLLLGKGKEEWEEALMKLKKIPEEQVQEKLIISYEALNHEQKQIFLDIACLFIGEDKKYPFYMWDACKFYPRNGINVLVLRSLVKIGDENELRMHDQLRDLGREIVREENIKEPGKRSRLWLHKVALKILKRRKGTKNVEALCLNVRVKPIDEVCEEIVDMLKTSMGTKMVEESHHHCFTNKQFGKLPNLRFLQMDRADLSGDFKHLLSGLIWLRWRYCLGNFMLTNFHLKNLVIFDLSYSKITDDWEVWSQIKMARKLKVLNLSCCSHITRTPDFSTFATLEVLILRRCKKLVQIDPSIGDLINLRELDISSSGITKLPNAIGNLEKLEEINTLACKIRGEIPSNIGRLSSLRILRLNSTNIGSLLTSICGLSCLQILHLNECKTPSDCGEVNALSQLKQLEVNYCKNLQFLGLPSSLFELDLHGFKSVERLSDLSNLKNLSTLSISRCSELREIQGLGKLELLTSLDVSLCGKLARLDGIEQLKSLRYLNTAWCESLERLPDLSNLKKLETLITKDCEKLIEIQGLDRLESLEDLVMGQCKSIKRFPDLSNLKKFKKLVTKNFEKLVEIRGLDRLESLECLKMDWCLSIKRLPDLSNLKKLQTLVTKGCEKLTKIHGLDSLESLERLNMDWCISIEKLPDLSNLERLKGVSLRQCCNLADMEGLKLLKSLESLDVSGCKSLERKLDLSNLNNLKELKIRGWKKLTKIRGLEELESLKWLDISRCKIRKSPDLSNLKKLVELNVSWCEKLTEIWGLEELKSLELLDISGCKLIENLPNSSSIEIRSDSREEDLTDLDV